MLGIAVVIIFVILVGQIYYVGQDQKETGEGLLVNISSAIDKHNNDVLNALPQSNFTAQKQAIENIEELKEGIAEIKTALNISS